MVFLVIERDTAFSVHAALGVFIPQCAPTHPLAPALSPTHPCLRSQAR